MKNFQKKILLLGSAVLLAGAVSAGCSGGDDDDDGSTPTPSPTATTFTQIERLARPAINEGLIVTNAYLNAFNMIPPSADLSDAAAPVRAEAVAVLEAVDGLDGTQNVDSNVIAGIFLPDVMRIDTTKTLTGSAYAGSAATSGILTGGRKITDDVIDITLTVLVGSPVGDGVKYEGVPGNPAQPGHSPVQATFPYLAKPIVGP